MLNRTIKQPSFIKALNSEGQQAALKYKQERQARDTAREKERAAAMRKVRPGIQTEDK